MLSGIIISFARPEESRGLVRLLREVRRVNWECGVLQCGNYGSTPITVVHTGIGPEAAKQVVAAVLAIVKPARWIAGGFAGALDPALAITDVVTQIFEPGTKQPKIISRELPVETAGEKSTLFLKTGAQAIDMESDAIAMVLNSAHVPMLAIRVISDRADQDLPVPFTVWFNPDKQSARPIALLAYLLVRPSAALQFYQFVVALPRVSAALAKAILKHLP